MEKTKRVQESTCVHSNRSEPLNGAWGDSEVSGNESARQGCSDFGQYPKSQNGERERSGYALGLELTEVGRIAETL